MTVPLPLLWFFTLVTICSFSIPWCDARGQRTVGNSRREQCFKLCPSDACCDTFGEECLWLGGEL